MPSSSWRSCPTLWRLGWDGKDETRLTWFQILPNLCYVYTVDQFLKDGSWVPLLCILLPVGHAIAVHGCYRTQEEELEVQQEVCNLVQESWQCARKWSLACSGVIRQERQCKYLWFKYLLNYEHLLFVIAGQHARQLGHQRVIRSLERCRPLHILWLWERLAVITERRHRDGPVANREWAYCAANATWWRTD